MKKIVLLSLLCFFCANIFPQKNLVDQPGQKIELYKSIYENFRVGVNIEIQDTLLRITSNKIGFYSHNVMNEFSAIEYTNQLGTEKSSYYHYRPNLDIFSNELNKSRFSVYIYGLIKTRNGIALNSDINLIPK